MIIRIISHRLRYLNLDNNEIYTIPHLKLLGTSPLKPAKSTEQNLMTHTSSSSSLDGTPALIHSSSTLPVLREEGSQIDDARESSRAGTREEDWVVADDAKPTEQGEGRNDPRTTKSEPSLVDHLKIENVLEEVEEESSSTSKQAIPSDATFSDKLSKTPLHSEVSQVKSEPSLVHQSAKTDSKIEAEDTSGDIKEKNLPSSPSGHTTTTSDTTPPPHTDITPPAQIDQSAEGGGVGNLQLISGGDENLKELAPFPQLETLSLVNNLVSKS